ncbi:MAG TPA: molybdopterin cofactor-binding domain-containing protein, partial [Fibrella sp.]
MIAEELEVGIDQITIKQSDGMAKYGSQFAVGSGTVRTEWKRLREAGAAARNMLVQAAATRWGVPVSECYAQRAIVNHRPTGKSLSYAELVEDAAKLEVPKAPALKARKDFKLLGTSVPKPDVPAKSSGKAIYAIDVQVPNMLYASIQHSPTIFGKIISVDDSQATKIPGVKAVVRTERPMPSGNIEAVAVVATSYWAALKGRRALAVNWDTSGYDEQMTSQRYTNDLKAAVGKPSATYTKSGDVNAALAAAPLKLEGLYETPFLAHAPMEPEVTVAHVKDDGSCEIWASVQGTDMAKMQAAGYLKIPAEKVTVHMPFLGGGFGRKGSFDFMLEAINVSRQVKAPVKVIWTREDDITQGPYRPAMLSAMRGGIDAAGQVVAFEHTFIGESLSRQVFRAPLGDKAEDFAGESISAKESPYAFPNAHIGYINVQTDIPITFWRSVYSSNNVFGHESFMDELAHASHKDPLALRLDLLKGQDDEVARRFSIVLETLAQKAGWDKPRAAGKGKGIAISRA